MKNGFLYLVFIVGVALAFNACANKIDKIEEQTSVDAVNESNAVDTMIENRIISGGVLSLTEDELSREIVSRAIERRITFTVTHLSDRDKTIQDIENIMKDQGETYRVIKEDRPGVMEVISKSAISAVDGATIGSVGGTFIFPGIGSVVGGTIGGVVGGAGALAYSLKDYIGDIFAKDTNWLISKSPDKSVLNILFIKDQNE